MMAMKNNSSFDSDYLPYIIKTGRLTNLIGCVVCFAPALVIAGVFGVLPPFSAILNGFIAISSAVGVIWFVEPISYFPIIGVAGTYMAFLSGNIGNLRIPCAMVAQKVAGVEPATNEGSIIATLGMAVSIVVNTAILTIGVVAGAGVLSRMPASVTSALQFLLPALFGAIFVQFAVRKPKLAPIVLCICVLVVLGVRAKYIPGYISTLGAVFLSITAGIMLYKRGLVK